MSFAKKILQITASECFDPEDVDDESVAKVLPPLTDTSQTANSCLRRRNAPLLEDIDQAYAGKKISSKNLKEDMKTRSSSGLGDLEDTLSLNSSDNESDDDESWEDDDDDDESGDEMDEGQIDDFKKTLLMSKEREDQNSDIDSENGISNSEESVDEEDENEDQITQHFAQIDVSSEVEKGMAIKNQKELWNRLLEGRIKLQKLLTISNKLPQSSTWKSLENNAEVTESIAKSSESLKALEGKLLALNNALISKNEELKSICLDFDKRILDTSEKANVRQKRKLDTESDVLEKRFKALIPYRNSVIQNFDEKTKLSSGKMTQKSFNAFDNSALKQIEMILQDRTRLIKRTQLKRSLYKTIGKPDLPTASDIEASSSSKQDMLIKDYDPEIFDDDDFYRQTLKDVIDNKTFGVDSIYIQKQMEIQKQRNKMKRKVDTRASKGRKLRYDVHPKMVNFCAKLQVSFMSENARNEILKGLFV